MNCRRLAPADDQLGRVGQVEVGSVRAIQFDPATPNTRTVRAAGTAGADDQGGDGMHGDRAESRVRSPRSRRASPTCPPVSGAPAPPSPPPPMAAVSGGPPLARRAAHPTHPPGRPPVDRSGQRPPGQIERRALTSSRRAASATVAMIGATSSMVRTAARCPGWGPTRRAVQARHPEQGGGDPVGARVSVPIDARPIPHATAMANRQMTRSVSGDCRRVGHFGGGRLPATAAALNPSPDLCRELGPDPSVERLSAANDGAIDLALRRLE